VCGSFGVVLIPSEERLARVEKNELRAGLWPRATSHEDLRDASCANGDDDSGDGERAVSSVPVDCERSEAKCSLLSGDVALGEGDRSVDGDGCT
jgi:hypothetical protein